VLLLLRLVERREIYTAVGLGAVCGLAILGNVRMALLPLILVAFLLTWAGRGRQVVVLGVVALAACAAVVLPWVARNQANVGCAAVTTDGRALWKANNVNTYRVLRHGGWIDHVPAIPGTPPTPQDAYNTWVRTGHYVATDECAQMRFYQHRAVLFMEHHVGEKAKLAVLGGSMLWDPRTTETRGRPHAGGFLDVLRRYVEATWMIGLLVAAVAGFVIVGRRLRSFVLTILVYQTLLAALFVGETRYRIPWDFLLALLAAAALVRGAERVRARRDA
jgi:4-amino-4-deoxy-L-arabinose transferase-like glycosyltransferase